MKFDIQKQVKLLTCAYIVLAVLMMYECFQMEAMYKRINHAYELIPTLPRPADSRA